MTIQASAAAKLRQYVEQVESLLEDITERKEEVKEKFSEMKSEGFDVKIVRKIIARRRRSKADLQEEDALLATYMYALEGTPMGEFLARQEAHA